jgi:dTDP-4-dehydrorhamnose reductase
VNALVVGWSGQLARHLRELWPTAMFWSRQQLDLGAPEAVRDAIESSRPAIIVNAAAYTAVDRAESDSDLAWRVNVEAPAAMARAARTLDVPLIHISTDYVFDGTSSVPYVESAPVAPLNVYGRTKLAAELAVSLLCQKHWILRTSWVFSEFGSNFVKTILRLARERDTLKIVDDQHGRPTYAGDLANVIDALVRQQPWPGAVPWGLYHVAGGTAVSWCGFARAIVDRAHGLGVIERVPTVVGIPSSGYPTPATRPARTVLQASPALDALGVVPDWQEGLTRAIRSASRD